MLADDYVLALWIGCFQRGTVPMLLLCARSIRRFTPSMALTTDDVHSPYRDLLQLDRSSICAGMSQSSTELIYLHVFRNSMNLA